MATLSRRRFLGAVAGAGLAVGTSGCTGTTGTPTATPTANEVRLSHAVETPDARRVRNPNGAPAVRSSLVDPPGGWTDATWAVSSPDDRESLEFAPEAVGVDAAREFVRATDLSARTVLVDQYRVGACSTRRLERLRWDRHATGPGEGAGVAVEYATVDRDADCEEGDPADVEATLVRVPADVERVDYFSSSW